MYLPVTALDGAQPVAAGRPFAGVIDVSEICDEGVYSPRASRVPVLTPALRSTTPLSEPRKSRTGPRSTRPYTDDGGTARLYT